MVIASQSLPLCYRFAEFELREHSAELRHGDESLRLPDQAWAVLLALLRAAGDLVTREELRQQLWPDKDFGDFDGGLNAAVRKLRRVLQDDGTEPHLIGTLPKHGYRMLVPVEVVEDSPLVGNPAAEARPHTPPRVPIGRLLRWSMFLFLLVGGLGLWAIFAMNGKQNAGVRIHSIALLPLANLSGDPTQDYLAASLTEQMIQELALRQDLQVAPFAAVSPLRQDRVLPGELCRRLGVDAFVEGSIRREGNRILLHLRLVPGSSGLATWAQTLDMPWKDLGDVPPAGASRLARALDLSSNPSRVPGGSRDAEATAAYWEARYEFSLLNAGGIEKALALYGRAIQKDPGFASAHGGLANAALWRGLVNRSGDNASLAASYRHALRALELDPACLEAHLALAFIHWLHDWDFTAAEGSFQKALEVAPRSAQARAAYASYLFARGRSDEAISHLAQAEPSARNDPVVAMDVLRCYTLSRRHQEAIEFGRSILADRPHWTWVHGHIFEACVALGREKEAIEANLNAVADLPELARRLEGVRQGSDLKGMLRREAMWNESQQAQGRPFEGAGIVAYLWAALGERERALHWLETAATARDSDALFVLRYPYWDAFRGDPRFEELLQNLGIGQDPRPGSPETS